MGRASRGKRQPDGAPSIHDQIALEAAQATASPGGLTSDRYPALRQLLQAARAEVVRSTPRQVVYEGRTYWCRVTHGMSLLELFDSPAKGAPIIRTICGSSDAQGHEPAN